jgi:hypothetical protein
VLEGSTKLHPTSLVQRLRANSKCEHGHNWKKKSALLQITSSSCAKCIIDINKTSGKSTMSKALSKCF